MILEEAVRLLQDEGLDALTVRRLAARLGVEAPSLYKHFPSKRRLLGQVTVHLLAAQVDQVEDRGSWQEWLMDMGRVFWSTQTRIRDSARLVATTDFDAAQLDLMASLLRTRLKRYDIDDETATSMHFGVQALVLGLSVLAEGRSADLMREVVPFDAILESSLQALISGWETTLLNRKS